MKTQYLTNEELGEFRRVDSWKSLGSFAWTWGWIAAAMALYIRHPSVWTFLAGWVIVSGRHLGLAILLHEGAHNLILKNKQWNDRIGQWLAGYPILSDMLVYRMIHLQHHKHTWTKQDPDLGLAKPFPITRRSLWRKAWRDLSGRTGYQRYRQIIRLSSGLSFNGKGLEGKSLRQCVRTFVERQKGFLITNAVILAAVSVFGRPEAYLLLWVLPAMTGYSLVLRLRSIAEHAVVTDPTDELLQTRTTLARAWLRFFIAPHNVNYHLEHHLYMWIPHYNLAKVHKLLGERGVLDRAEVARGGYLEVLRKAASKPAEDEAPRKRASVLPFSGG